MKVITTGSQRVNCEQCGSTLEYEWRDISEYNGVSHICCPVCGFSIAVPKHIEANPYSDLHNCSISGIVGPFDSYKIQTVPYDMFERSGIYASNTAAHSDNSVALTAAKTEAKVDDVCTLTATI